MARFALDLQFSLGEYHWYLPELRSDGNWVEFDVFAPLDAQQVQRARELFAEREQALPDDPLARALFEKEALPQLPWPQGVTVQLAGNPTDSHGSLAAAGWPQEADAVRLRQRWPRLCGKAFYYACHRGKLLRPVTAGKPLVFLVRETENSVVLAKPFSLSDEAPHFCHPLTGISHTLELRGTRELFFPGDRGMARRMWTYAVTPPLEPGASLSIREAHRQGGGAIGYSISEPGVDGAFFSEPYPPAQPLEPWRFFFDRLRLSAPPPLQVTALPREER